MLRTSFRASHPARALGDHFCAARTHSGVAQAREGREAKHRYVYRHIVRYGIQLVREVVKINSYKIFLYRICAYNLFFSWHFLWMIFYIQVINLKGYIWNCYSVCLKCIINEWRQYPSIILRIIFHLLNQLLTLMSLRCPIISWGTGRGRWRWLKGKGLWRIIKHVLWPRKFMFQFSSLVSYQ